MISNKMWLDDLSEEDLDFIKKFILLSGSLKSVAKEYGVSYPTVRLRLDKLIQKISVSMDSENDSYVKLIKRMVLDDKIDFDTAKILIREYRREL